MKKSQSTSDSTFKTPQPKASVLGLDKLAALKRKVKEEEEKESKNDKKSRVTSFHDDWDEGDDVEDERDDVRHKHKSKKDRYYRPSRIDTPSHPGGVSEEFRQKLSNKHKDKERGVYASSSKEKDRERKKDRHKHKHDKRDRNRSKSTDRERHRSRDRDRSARSQRSYREWEETPERRRDEPPTPEIRPKDTPSRSAWDDDDDITPPKKSSWDLPTPRTGSRKDDFSERSDRSDRSHHSDRSYRSQKEYVRSEKRYRKKNDDTPMPTPSYKYNEWMDNRKSIKYTPRPGNEGKENRPQFESEEEQALWEEEQKRLDREWYGLDEGYDDEHNPFSGMSAEYTKRKEEEIEKKKKKRMSAQQRQINKDNEMWEINRMLRSGAVQRVEYDDDFDEDNEARVHLLVYNIVPPFLDGRMVFTKQPEPVVPVKDPTSDMAITSRKGSQVVRTYREQKERRKAQVKHWELAGTRMGDIMGVEKKRRKG